MLFALKSLLCFWLVLSFCNWQHRFGRLPRFGRLSRLGRLHWFGMVWFGGLHWFDTRSLFALNMPLCFWLVPSFGNWQHRFR